MFAGFVMLLLALFGVYVMDLQSTETPLLRAYGDDECTKEMQAACAVDIERTAKNCAKVFATDGAAIISDIKCYRDVQNDRKKCWPCLCE